MIILTLFLSFSAETVDEISMTVTKRLIVGIKRHSKATRPLFSKAVAKECKRDTKLHAYRKCVRLQVDSLADVKKKHEERVKLLKIANALREQELVRDFRKAIQKSKDNYNTAMAQSLKTLKEEVNLGKFYFLRLFI